MTAGVASAQTTRRLPTAVEASVGYALVKAGWTAAGQLTKALAPLGVRPKEYAVLSALEAHGPRSQGSLGELLGIDPSTMVALIDELERRGLAERRRNPSDRRAYAVHLTEEGIGLLPRLHVALGQADDRLMAGLSDDRRRQLLELLAELGTAQDVPLFLGSAACRSV